MSADETDLPPRPLPYEIFIDWQPYGLDLFNEFVNYDGSLNHMRNTVVPAAKMLQAKILFLLNGRKKESKIAFLPNIQ